MSEDGVLKLAFYQPSGANMPKPVAREFYQFVISIPQYASGLTTPVFITSAVTLVALFVPGGAEKGASASDFAPAAAGGCAWNRTGAGAESGCHE